MPRSTNRSTTAGSTENKADATESVDTTKSPEDPETSEQNASDRATEAQESSQAIAKNEAKRNWAPLQGTLNADPTKDPSEDALRAKPEVIADRRARGIIDVSPAVEGVREELAKVDAGTVTAQLTSQVRQFDTSGLSGQRSDVAAAAVVFNHPSRNLQIAESPVTRGEGTLTDADAIRAASEDTTPLTYLDNTGVDKSGRKVSGDAPSGEYHDTRR